MLYLDSEDSTKPIYMYVNCPGGSVIAGLAIYDTMQHIKVSTLPILCSNTVSSDHEFAAYCMPYRTLQPANL
jgi:ATP-dependent protease ClpP protease subunit